MKYNKNLPAYYRVTPQNEQGESIGESKICASYFGIKQHLRNCNTIYGDVHSVQKIEGSYMLVEGKANLIIHGRIKI